MIQKLIVTSGRVLRTVVYGAAIVVLGAAFIAVLFTVPQSAMGIELLGSVCELGGWLFGGQSDGKPPKGLV